MRWEGAALEAAAGISTLWLTAVGEFVILLSGKVEVGGGVLGCGIVVCNCGDACSGGIKTRPAPSSGSCSGSCSVSAGGLGGMLSRPSSEGRASASRPFFSSSNG